MKIINYTHALTAEQAAAIKSITGQPVEEVHIPAHLDHARPFAEQARELVDAAGLTPAAWQGQPLLVIPPALAPAAVAVLAELHGRMGYWPATVRIRPVAGVMPPQYEVAEIINLQASRDEARTRR